jgi:hypothetical protein
MRFRFDFAQFLFRRIFGGRGITETGTFEHEVDGTGADEIRQEDRFIEKCSFLYRHHK